MTVSLFSLRLPRSSDARSALYPLAAPLLGAASGFVVSLAGGAAVGSVLMALGAVGLAIIAARARSRIEAATTRADSAQALLQSASALAVRDDQGNWTVSRAFRAVLGDDGQDDPPSALSALSHGETDPAWSALLNQGTPFRLDVRTSDDRWLRLAGQRLAGASVLSVEDHSEDRRNGLRLSEDAEALRVQLAFWQNLPCALPLPIWVRDAEGRLAACNETYAQSVEADKDTAVAEQRDLVSDGAGRALAQRVLRGRTAVTERLPGVVSGSRRIFEVTETPLQANGSGFALLGHAIDRTEVETIRDDLRRQLDAHAEVLERLNTAIAIFAADTRLTFFNQAYARLWGLDESWLHSEPTHGELMEELRARRRLPEAADFQTFKRDRINLYTRLIEPVEELMHLPDGTTLRLLATPHPLGGLILVQEDVTNRLALESSYNTLMAVQQETLDSLAEGIAVFGGDGRLKLSNPAFARIWDMRDGDLQGEPHITDLVECMRSFFPEADGDEGATNWEILKEEMIAATLERSVRSGRLQRFDGSVVEFSTLPLPDGAVLNSYLDVTDSVRLQEALLASNAALESADELKSEFISNISHHLRTPLNGIIGFAEVLSNQYFGPLNSRQIEYVKGIVNAGERLLEVIDDIVDLSSVGAGVSGLERSTVDLADVVETVASLTREWARAEGVRLEVSLQPALGTIDGDARRLKQALFTLVVSALRNAPRDSTIVLAVARGESGVVVTVGDRTAGPHSYRHAAADSLGLTLVRNVIELHGGEMRIDGAPGRLSRVRCVLPVRPPAAPDA